MLRLHLMAFAPCAHVQHPQSLCSAKLSKSHIFTCSLISTLKQILEALQPLQKLLELLNPRYDSVLRNTFEQGRLNRMLPALGATVSFSAARAGAALGSAGRYRNAAGTAGSLLMSSGPGREAGQSLRSMPGLSKGLRRARDEHGGQCMPVMNMCALLSSVLHPPSGCTLQDNHLIVIYMLLNIELQ